MAGKYTDEQLKAKMASPGWQLSRNKEAPVTGTLQNLLNLSHQRRKKGEAPGLIQEIETSIEIDMIVIERLWLAMGLPV